MARTVSRKRKKKAPSDPLISFRYDNTDYQIDTEQRKVYRNWVAVESARQFMIMSAWSTTAQ